MEIRKCSSYDHVCIYCHALVQEPLMYLHVLVKCYIKGGKDQDVHMQLCNIMYVTFTCIQLNSDAVCSLLGRFILNVLKNVDH